MGIEKSQCRYSALCIYLRFDVRRESEQYFLPLLGMCMFKKLRRRVESDLYSCVLRKRSQDIRVQSPGAATQHQERTLQVHL